MSASNQNVKVVVRCRPLLDVQPVTPVKCDEAANEVTVSKNVMRKYNCFDKVFDEFATQADVFKSVGSPMVDEVLQGFNATIFAYGQTGSGKTFTMFGEEDVLGGKGAKGREGASTTTIESSAGLVPRCVQQLYSQLKAEKRDFAVKLTFVEIYNEELIDLLQPGKVDLRLIEESERVSVKGLHEEYIEDIGSLFQHIARGIQARRTAETKMNKKSSRSHSICSVTVQIKEVTLDGSDLVKVGKLNLVDLAGSESGSRSGAQDMRAREAGNINQSLLTLGRVINALVDSGVHVPYRDSKLTRILQDSLGGRTKTCMVATISPTMPSLEETINTLDYAMRARNVKNRPEINVKISQQVVIRDLTRENQRLKAALRATQGKAGVYLPQDVFEEMHASKELWREAERTATEQRQVAQALREEVASGRRLLTEGQAREERVTERCVELSAALQAVDSERRELHARLIDASSVYRTLHAEATARSRALAVALSAHTDRQSAALAGMEDALRMMAAAHERSGKAAASASEGAAAALTRAIARLDGSDSDEGVAACEAEAHAAALEVARAALAQTCAHMHDGVREVEDFARQVEEELATGASQLESGLRPLQEGCARLRQLTVQASGAAAANASLERTQTASLERIEASSSTALQRLKAEFSEELVAQRTACEAQIAAILRQSADAAARALDERIGTALAAESRAFADARCQLGSDVSDATVQVNGVERGVRELEDYFELGRDGCASAAKSIIGLHTDGGLCKQVAGGLTAARDRAADVQASAEAALRAEHERGTASLARVEEAAAASARASLEAVSDALGMLENMKPAMERIAAAHDDDVQRARECVQSAACAASRVERAASEAAEPLNCPERLADVPELHQSTLGADVSASEPLSESGDVHGPERRLEAETDAPALAPFHGDSAHGPNGGANQCQALSSAHLDHSTQHAVRAPAWQCAQGKIAPSDAATATEGSRQAGVGEDNAHLDDAEACARERRQNERCKTRASDAPAIDANSCDTKSLAGGVEGEIGSATRRRILAGCLHDASSPRRMASRTQLCADKQAGRDGSKLPSTLSTGRIAAPRQ